MENKHLTFNTLYKQLGNIYFIDKTEIDYIEQVSDSVWDKLKYNISHLKNKYYDHEVFNPYHNCQYLMFLYITANTIYKNFGYINICDKIYNLSKIFSGSDIFYAINLPKIFSFDHPVGSVLGRAEYNNYFFCCQGCTVGGNKDIYPKLGESVIMYSNSKILGNCNIGNNVILSANAYIKDIDIPSNCIVFPSNKTKNGIFIKEISESKMKEYFFKLFKY